MTIASDARFTRRALLVGAGMGAVGVTLAGRMAYLSVWEGAKYAAQAEGNRVSLRLIPPRRGWIVDRTGKPLALNAPDYRLELLPDQITDLDATLAAVGKVLPLTADDLARIRADLARQPKYMPVEIAHGLDWPTFARVNVNLPDLPGVQPQPGYARALPRRRAFRPSARLCRDADAGAVRRDARSAADLPRLQDRQGWHRAPRRCAAARDRGRAPRRGDGARPGDPRPRHAAGRAGQDAAPDDRPRPAGLCRAPPDRQFGERRRHGLPHRRCPVHGVDAGV